MVRYSKGLTGIIDFFKYSNLKEANIVELKKVLVFTSVNEDLIQFRQYEVPSISETEVLASKTQMKEIGPHFDLKLRRSNIAATDLYKAACRKPRVLNVEKKRVSFAEVFLKYTHRQGRICTPQISEKRKPRCSSSNRILRLLLLGSTSG